MSTKVEPPAGEQAQEQDRFKNISMELNRKLDEREQRLDNKLQQLTASLMEAVKPRTPQAPQPEPDLDMLAIENPKEYARIVRDQATQAATQAAARANEATERRNQVLGRLVTDFPELQNQNSDVTKRAVEIYNTYSEAERNDPRTYELAVKSAAVEFGLKPMSKRSNQDSDDFTLSGGARAPRSTKKQDPDISAALAFAELMGRPVDDPDYVERLKAHAGRDTFTKYREPKPKKGQK